MTMITGRFRPLRRRIFSGYDIYVVGCNTHYLDITCIVTIKDDREREYQHIDDLVVHGMISLALKIHGGWYE
jgi:hypothetical protein